MDNDFCRKLLDKYIHEYMKRKNMHETAGIFAQEAGVDENLSLGIDSAEGFLTEWWDIFWDLFSSRVSQSRAGESASKAVVETGNVLPDFNPIMQIPPMGQQTIGNMQPNPFASLQRPEFIQQAMNTMQTLYPTLPGPEFIQQAMNATQTPYPTLPRLEMVQQAMNAMKSLHPVLPRPEMIQPAINGMQTPYPTLPSPEMIQQAMNAMKPPCSLLQMLEMNQPAMNAMQLPFPVLPRPEMNQQIMREMPMSMPDVSANFPASPGFDVQHGEMSAIVANPQLFDVETTTPLLPSSSNPRHGINLKTSKAAVPISEGAPQATVQEREISDAGKGKSIQEIPVQDHLLMVVGSFSPGIRQGVFSSPVPASNHQQQIPAFGGYHPQYHLAEPDAQNSGQLTSSAVGSFWNLPRPMLIHGDLQLPDNAQIGSVMVQQLQAPGVKIATDTVISKKRQTPTPKQRKLKESVKKRKNSSNVLPVQNKLDGKFAELQNPIDEDIQRQTSHENDNGFSFSEFASLHSSNKKFLCCHFTSTGSLLAGAGYENKILIWNMENLTAKAIDGHSDIITDVRFKPNSITFATSSFDKTLQIWDASEPNGHPSMLGEQSDHVMSLDFHPTNGNLLCSSDSNEMRMWDITNKTCLHTYQGGSRQVRFQPQNGQYLASATGNIVKLIDTETNMITQLKGHVKDVRSLCWDTSGSYIASVSEDSARIWAIKEKQCIHELYSRDNKYESCTFHPRYFLLMAIGTNKKLQLWNPVHKNGIFQSYNAHDGIISALTASPRRETIASASHDNKLKLWK
ncbi:hypothetical protein ACH5RR_017927 [Cinchona calisaya]|uniref:Uncharacterized protein n=1 Tax=Cinchona calisaya TaxID=153742 RepID=A0ABD2ZKC8_9GENT